MLSMHRGLRAVGCILSALWLGGCAVAPRTPFTEDQENRAEVVGAPGVRVFADQASGVFAGHKRDIDVYTSRVTYLALSGGGADGAFGAGILNGWTASGKRPQFTIVSGVSTGALIAPFAFLGSGYDPVIKDLYTSGVAKELVANASPFKALFGDSLVGEPKLLEIVSRYVDERLLDAIAAEHKSGRRLYVLTTNLDAQRGTIWDMGEIASRGPQALPLFRKVIAASASVPGLFKPIYIDVTTDGQVFQEMHVDGATVSQILTAPDRLLADLAGDPKQHGGHKDLYVLINGKMEPTFEVVKPVTLSITGRALSTALKQKALNNAVAAYEFAKKSGIGYNLVYMDRNLSELGSYEFETNYMRGLFDYGYQMAVTGNFWRHKPPPIEAPAPATPKAMPGAAPAVASAGAS